MPSFNSIELIFLLLIFAIVYTYLLYPLLLVIIARIKKNVVKADIGFEPDISIVLSAHNEEHLIEEAVRSVFNNGYPADKIKLFVGSDGSTDKTINILTKLQSDYHNLSVYDLPRGGKNKTLNMLLKNVKTDLVFFMDADIRIRSGALKRLVSLLADKSVGAAIASMDSISQGNADSGGMGENLYQKYENLLRINESRIHSTAGSLGALYGIKREYYKPLPNDKVCDDFMPLLDVAIAGKRVFFDSEAFVTEVRKKSLGGEFARRVRVSGGGLATIWQARRLLLPKYGWISFFLWSHRIFRWLTPIFLILIAILTLLIPLDTSLFLILVVLQILLYSFAILGWIFEKINIKFFPFRVALYFLTMCSGFLAAIVNFIAGSQNSFWEAKK